MTTNANQTVQDNPANIIARQLGGTQRLKAMIGAKDFFSDNGGMTLQFKFAMCRKASHIRITLNGNDLYDIEFIKAGRRAGTISRKTTGEFSDVYAEDLRRIIEEFTGLYLSL